MTTTDHTSPDDPTERSGDGGTTDAPVSAINDAPVMGLAAVAEVWRIAWPTVLAMTSYTAMQFVDKLMVGQVSPEAVAAQGNGGIWAFTILSALYGLVTVVNTYVSQHLGAGTPEEGPRYGWSAIWMCIGFWAALLVPFAIALPYFFNLLHGDASDPRLMEIVRLETGYGRILLGGGILMLLGRTMHHYFFGLHRPKVITVAAILGNLGNIAANFILIFGEAGLDVPVPGTGTTVHVPGIPGMPAYGLYGAAYGTVIGTAIEVVIPMAVFLGPKMNRELNSRAQWRPSWSAMKDIVRIGWPAAIQYSNEIICWAIFMTSFVGTFGADHMTAGWIALGYMHLSFMPAVGFSMAVTSIVGKYIGAGQPDIAVHRARLGLAMAMSYMTICALAFVIFREPFTEAFIASNATPQTAETILRIGKRLLICAAIFQTVDAIGIVYTGALRGAGDTIVPGVFTMVASWLLIVGGGYLMIRYMPQLESVGPWIAASVYIIAFGAFTAFRFEGGRWRRIKLVGTKRSIDSEGLGVGPPPSDPSAAIEDIGDR